MLAQLSLIETALLYNFNRAERERSKSQGGLQILHSIGGGEDRSIDRSMERQQTNDQNQSLSCSDVGEWGTRTEIGTHVCLVAIRCNRQAALTNPDAAAS